MNASEGNSLPFFSIITPTLNAAKTFSDAVQSVLAQNWKNYEHIVQDGGSTDGTQEIAASFLGISFLSEKDSGLYDAMNRAVARSRGEWILFLQADDWLEPDALQAFAQAIQATPQCDIVTGGASAVYRQGNQWATRWEKNRDSEKELTFEQIALGEPMLNARAYRKTLWNQTGGFNLSYSLASDRDFLLRLAEKNPPSSTVPSLVYRYRWHDGSRTMNAGNSLSSRLTQENLAIAEAHYRQSTRQTRATLRRWHRQESLRATLCALEAAGIPESFSSFFRGWQHDALFPIFFGQEFFASLVGFLLRGGKTRSQLLTNEAKE